MSFLFSTFTIVTRILIIASFMKESIISTAKCCSFIWHGVGYFNKTKLTQYNIGKINTLINYSCYEWEYRENAKIVSENETMQASLITRSTSQSRFMFLFYLNEDFIHSGLEKKRSAEFSSAQSVLMKGCVSILTWIQTVKWKKDNEEICLELAGFRAIQGLVHKIALYLSLSVTSSNKCRPLLPTIANNYQICLQIESLILCSRQSPFSHTNSQKYYFSSKVLRSLLQCPPVAPG